MYSFIFIVDMDNLCLCEQFVAESLDVIEDPDWVISLGNSFAKQYELYSSEDEHSALLHRYDALFLPFILCLNLRKNYRFFYLNYLQCRQHFPLTQCSYEFFVEQVFLMVLLEISRLFMISTL